MFRNDLNIFSNEKQKMKPKWQQNIQREDKCTKRNAGRIMKAIVWCCAIVIEIDITVQHQLIKQRLKMFPSQLQAITTSLATKNNDFFFLLLLLLLFLEKRAHHITSDRVNIVRLRVVNVQIANVNST